LQIDPVLDLRRRVKGTENIPSVGPEWKMKGDLVLDLREGREKVNNRLIDSRADKSVVLDWGDCLKWIRG
jgi:hypothetical protein